MSELAVGSLAGLAANSYVIDVASGSQLTQPGMILAVESVLKTDAFSATVAAGANTAVTDLSITHTLSNASNKLIISAYFGVAGSSSGVGEIGLAIANDGTLIGIGDSAGSRIQVGAGEKTTGSAASGNVNSVMPSVMFVYAPGDTSSHTYTVRIINWSGSSETVTVNRAFDDTDAATRIRGASGFIIQEVAV